MRDVSVFSVRDLRVNSSTLVREAEAGQVSIITKRGKPVVLALPFGSRLLEVGLDKDLADPTGFPVRGRRVFNANQAVDRKILRQFVASEFRIQQVRQHSVASVLVKPWQVFGTAL